MSEKEEIKSESKKGSKAKSAEGINKDADVVKGTGQALETGKEDIISEPAKLCKSISDGGTILDEDLTKPGNRDYLSYYVYQGEWRPTKALKPVSAQFSGPGPAGVNLPLTLGDHDLDLRKTRAPAYKFGERDLLTYEPVSPGPLAYNTRALTNKGKDECRAPFIANKLEGLTQYYSPGPAAYNRGDSDAIAYPHPPAYTMRPQTETTKNSFRGPDPSKYTLPGSLGPGITPFAGGPAYSCGERLEGLGIPFQNPGPAAYMLPSPDIHRRKTPAYSMGLRPMSERICTQTPGPASNFLHLVKFHKPSTPRFTFGIKHSPYKAFQKFAPGD